MSRQFWTDFLELYISFPCLWKFSDASYGNKNSRAAAMQTLLEKLHEVEPLADIKTLSRKINSFRTTFRQVYKKYNRPISSEGGASKDVEEPTLWYFKYFCQLLLAKDQQDTTRVGWMIAVFMTGLITQKNQREGIHLLYMP